MRIPCGTVVLALSLAAGCAAPPGPPNEAEKAADDKTLAATQATGGSSPTGSTFSDVCDLPSLGTSMFACLLPASDRRHNPSKRVAPDIDCFWQVKAPIDKDLKAEATGAWLAFTFNVENKCGATDVEVELASPPATLAIWHCPQDRMPIPRGSTNSLTCHTNYAMGTITRTRSYALRVVKVNGRIAAPVELDPEVVLEKSGAEGILPVFKVRQQQ